MNLRLVSGFPFQPNKLIPALQNTMSNRIDTTFQRLRNNSEAAFVAYVCAGDPNYDASLATVRALADAGADIIELGVPFSDPQADGIVNQLAAERALHNGMSVDKLIQFIRDFRTTHDTAIVLFTYLNPVYAYGYEKFHIDASAAGADGILLLDLPPDEVANNKELECTKGLKHITLISPSTPPERMQMLAAQSEGFIYGLSRMGVTGSQAAPSASIGALVASIKQHTDTPVCVGFGISTPEQASDVAAASDGVVVGSAIVNQVAENANHPYLAGIISEFTAPLISATKTPTT
jgi:tryptophan synthase alpha chain